MRYERSACEWSVMGPMLANKPHVASRVGDRRVLNGTPRLWLRLCKSTS